MRLPARPAAALAAVVGVWLVLTATIAVATPPWEANDEPDHVRNVQVLAGGDWYRIRDGAGFEAHQPPLYYLALAGWQQALGIPPREIAPTLVDPAQGTGRGVHRHDVPGDGADSRLVAVLRLPGVLLGLATILFTAAAARRLTDDPWTPPVAAAWVVAVPKFAFLSGVVNNDNLTNTVAAAATFVALVAVGRGAQDPRTATRFAAALGALLGLLILSKLSAAPLGAALVLAVALTGGRLLPRPLLWRALAVFGLAMLVVCGWWLAQNQVRYGDPLASAATHDHLERLFPPIFDTRPPLEQGFKVVPQVLYESFWYTSGYNQFNWKWFVYLPLWIGLAAALAGLMRRSTPLALPPGSLAVLWSFVASALLGLWIVGMDTTTVQGRIAFTGLPALACLAALGLARARVPVLARFALPALGAAMTFVAIRRDIVDIYF